MSWRSDVAKKAAGRPFKPLNASHVVQGTSRVVLTVAVLTWAALATEGPLSWLLWAGAVVQVHSLILGWVVAGAILAERERRLASLPAGWRDYLINGGSR